MDLSWNNSVGWDNNTHIQASRVRHRNWVNAKGTDAESPRMNLAKAALEDLLEQAKTLFMSTVRQTLAKIKNLYFAWLPHNSAEHTILLSNGYPISSSVFVKRKKTDYRFS
nr:PREDICTED: uncharacterized protein LOC105661870 isoform X2 [Megachile rotundata]